MCEHSLKELKSVQKLDALKMVQLVISESIVRIVIIYVSLESFSFKRRMLHDTDMIHS